MTSLDLIVLTTDSSPRMVTDEEVLDEEDTDNYENLLRLPRTRFSQSLFHLLEMIFHLPEMPNEHHTMDQLKQSLLQFEARRLGNLLLWNLVSGC